MNLEEEFAGPLSDSERGAILDAFAPALLELDRVLKRSWQRRQDLKARREELVQQIRSAELGAQTALVTRGAFGGMAANDGPVPVRTLAYAARLMRDARQLERYGVTVSSPRLDYERLLERVRQVVAEVRDHSSLRHEIDRLGVRVHEHAGTARFGDAHTIEAGSGLRLPADRVVLCPGGASRRLGVPGSELAATHSDAWSLREVPRSLLVVGAGMTGLQVATVFHAFGARVQLVQSGPRILAAEDPEAAGVAKLRIFAGLSVEEAAHVCPQ